jgi:hypothetical protein
MVSGIMLAVLQEQHADRIVLSDSTDVPLPAGLLVERITSGSRVMILYRRGDEGGAMVVLSVTRSIVGWPGRAPPSEGV